MIFTFIPMPFTGLNVQNSKTYGLEKENKVLKSSFFQDSGSSCFQGFFYLESLQKTGITTPCTSSAVDPTLPNCNTGRYALCVCGGVSNNNCSNCSHQGYISLLNMNNKVIVLEALGAPDASRTSVSDINSDVYIETFVLPPIPFQKWFMITINREGRRFDIYYNGTLVLSKHTSANIYPTITSDEIIVGNTMLNGSSGFFNIYNSLQTASSIQNYYKSVTNTRGSPLFNQNPPDIAYTSLSLDRLSINAGLPNIPSVCSSGDCISSPKLPPSNPYYYWNTNYA